MDVLSVNAFVFVRKDMCTICIKKIIFCNYSVQHVCAKKYFFPRPPSNSTYSRSCLRIPPATRGS